MPPCVAVDVEAMRAAAAALLGPGAFLRQDELAQQRLLLRRHLAELVPVVEAAARVRPAESVPRAVALAEVEATRGHLDTEPGPGLVSAVRHISGLAHALRALCDHHDTLTGARPLGAV